MGNGHVEAQREPPVRDPAPPAPTTLTSQRRSSQPGIQIGNVIAQAKLSVGPAGDKYEREADVVAARVVRSLRSATSATDQPVADQTSSRVQRVVNATADRGVGHADGSPGNDGASVGGRVGRIRRSSTQPGRAASPPGTLRIQRSTRIGAEGGDLAASGPALVQRSGGADGGGQSGTGDAAGRTPSGGLPAREDLEIVAEQVYSRVLEKLEEELARRH